MINLDALQGPLTVVEGHVCCHDAPPAAGAPDPTLGVSQVQGSES
jgi:hypothetical protein